MSPQRLQSLLSRFPDLSVLVVGDFFLDKYLILDPALTETSIETDLEAYQVVEKRCSPGAAGTVTSNLHALEVGTLHALGVIGDDGEGYELKQGLAATNVQTDSLIESPDRFTPTYTKPMMRESEGELEINRIDIKNRAPMPPHLEDRLIEHLKDMVPEVDGIIIADQVQECNFGVITARVREEMASLARAHPDTFVLADSRVRIGEYRRILLKPNRVEAVKAVQPNYEGPTDNTLAEQCGKRLFEQTQKPVYLTLSEEGLLLITADGCEHIPGVTVPAPTDPVGAGDSTTAGIIAALCAGASYSEAGLIGNLIASITVQQLGATGTASPEQVRERYKGLSDLVID